MHRRHVEQRSEAHDVEQQVSVQAVKKRRECLAEQGGYPKTVTDDRKFVGTVLQRRRLVRNYRPQRVVRESTGS